MSFYYIFILISWWNLLYASVLTTKRRKTKERRSFRKESDRKTSKRRRKTMEQALDSLMTTNTTSLTTSSLISDISIRIPQDIDSSPEKYPEELDNSNVEYKLKLTQMNMTKLEKRITQMKFRLQEGHSLCKYFIGVEDSGNPLGINEDEMQMSIESIMKMTTKIDATIQEIKYMKGIEGYIAEVTITKHIREKDISEIGIGLLGEEDSGKSTLVGCLITDKRDNGKGLTRTNVFRHRHEINCGKTSSFTHQIIGFDKEGNKTNVNSFGTVAPWSTIVDKSCKIVNFIDMGGSEKALNISLRTISSDYYNYIFLLISAQQGLTENTILFLKLALIINVPVVVIVTKIDLVNDHELNDLVIQFKAVLKTEKKGKNPLVVKDTNDILTFAKNMNEGIMPIFLLSNTTGYGLNSLNSFLSILPSTETEIDTIGNDNQIQSQFFQFDFLEIINKRTEELSHVIIEGIVSNGIVNKGGEYLIGPFNDGKFESATVITIHSKRLEVNNATKGHFCSVELKLNNANILNALRPGMVLIDSSTSAVSTTNFTAELYSLSDKPIILKQSYQPIVHLAHISQCAKISSASAKSSKSTKTISETKSETETVVLLPSESVHLNFQFLYHPEFFKTGMLMLILDNHIKLYGYVKELIS